MRLTPLIVLICVLGLLLYGLIIRDQEFEKLQQQVNRLERQLDILRNYSTSKHSAESTGGVQILNIDWGSGEVMGVTNADPIMFETDD